MNVNVYSRLVRKSSVLNGIASKCKLLLAIVIIQVLRPTPFVEIAHTHKHSPELDDDDDAVRISYNKRLSGSVIRDMFFFLAKRNKP